MILLDDLLRACDGHLLGRPYATTFHGFCYDSRILNPGEIFVALVTDTGDGHDHVLTACRAGAAGVLCQRPPTSLPEKVSVVAVENTQQALLDYARYILRARGVRVVGITGSVGKTSTKEAAAEVLATRLPVFRNPGSFNGRFGLPIALGSLEDGQHLAVLEMASDAFGEIRDLAHLTRPHVGVVTNVGPSHLAYFGTLDQIAHEKGHLVAALPAEGVAILNWDDPRVRALAERTRARLLRYGRSAEADLRLLDVRVHPDCTEARVCWREEEHTLVVSLLGAHHAHTILAAAAVGLEHGLTWDEISLGLARVRPLPGRTLRLAAIHGATILDDTYNASPTSLQAALDTLAALPARRRLVLMGDMAQLGNMASSAHRAAGQAIATVADLLVTKGELAQLAAEAAVSAGLPADRVRVTYSAEDALHILHEALSPGDLLLAKGSAEARLETVVRGLLAAPERDAERLPRQHSGWQRVTLQRPGRPTWVEIDLAAAANNVRRLAEWVGPEVAVMAVLKADGYGHGAVKVARTALHNGASWLGVACLGEALTLRQTGIDAPILVLGYTPPWQAREAVLNDVVCTVFSDEVAEALSRAGLDLCRTARAHVKVDTGMGRLGLLPDQALPFIRHASMLPAIEIDGLYTHLAAADAEDLDYTLAQLDTFDALLDTLRVEGLLPPRIHAANSAALLRLPRSHYAMVRPGIALYGLDPSPQAPCPPGFLPVLSFKCQIAQVKELPAASPVGYGCAYRTPRASRIAVIPVGYADGFRRAPRHWGYVLVRGQRAPIVGRVCMDQTMVDVTDIVEARAGDEVVLLGEQGEERLTADAVAARLGTINYEVVSEILARVPRIV